jgi:hypothetical protein
MRKWRLSPQRQIAPVFSPSLRQLGGAPRASRRFLWRKSRHSVALLVLAAAFVGGSFANLLTHQA